MNSQELFEKSKSYILQLIRNKISNHCKVYLFGSRARGEAGFSADIDLAIGGVTLEAGNLQEIQDELEESFVPYKVDLIDLAQVDQKFKSIVMQRTEQWM